MMISLGPEDTQETWSSSQRIHEATTRVEGVPKGVGRAPYLMGPSEISWPNSFTHIYSYTLKTSVGGTKPLFHRRNLLYP